MTNNELDFDINKFLQDNKDKIKARAEKYIEICKANGIDEEDLLAPTEEDIREWQGY
jgi:hypothetical protein